MFQTSELQKVVLTGAPVIRQKTGDLVDYDIIWACQYCRKVFDNQKKTQYHENLTCIQNPLKNVKCVRCGRKGHYQTNCYAITRSDGQFI